MKIDALADPVPGRDSSGRCGPLRGCVQAGASIGFVGPLSDEEAEASRWMGSAAAPVPVAECASCGRGIGHRVPDTSAESGGAAGFHGAPGYSRGGAIPAFALDPCGTPVKNAVHYKEPT